MLNQIWKTITITYVVMVLKYRIEMIMRETTIIMYTNVVRFHTAIYFTISIIQLTLFSMLYNDNKTHKK